MIKNTLLLALLTFVVSCSTSKKADENVTDSAALSDTSGQEAYEDEYERFMDINSYRVSVGVKADEFQVIDSTGVVIINPTAEQMAEMEEEYGEDFLTFADDAAFYHANAMSVLDSVNIKTISAEKRYLKFQGDDGKTWLVDTRVEGAPEWNIIFFNRKKTPQIVTAIDVDRREIEQYFDVP